MSTEQLADLIGETPAAPKQYRFKCISPGVSPNAPIFVTDQFWEAEEMKRNPEYVEVDANGVVIPNAAEAAESRIPFSPPVQAKRPTLSVKRTKK